MLRKIIIVENDAVFSAILASTLELDGYEVTVFTDSNAAWDALKESNSASLLLTRIRFESPQPNGLSLAAHARRGNPDLSVIYLTDNPELALIAQEQHHSPVFLKPFNVQAIEECIQNMMDGAE